MAARLEVRYDMLTRQLPPAPDLASSSARPAPSPPLPLRAGPRGPQRPSAEYDDPWGFLGPVFGR